jgi:acyl-CoA thioester hydrolase
MFTGEVTIRIPFHDVDVMNVAWHGHYWKYFERARTELMQSLGLDWPVLKAHHIAMPVVDARAQYRRPLLYDEEYRVTASLDEYHYPEMLIDYRILSSSGRLHAQAQTRQVYADAGDLTSYFTVPEFIMQQLREKERGGSL